MTDKQFDAIRAGINLIVVLSGFTFLGIVWLVTMEAQR